MLNERIRSARIYRKLTLQNCADYLHIELRSFQKYEAGDVAPSYEKLVLIADFLNVPTDWLLCRDDYLKSLGVIVEIPQVGPPRHPKA